jgi:hypothetical protein
MQRQGNRSSIRYTSAVNRGAAASLRVCRQTAMRRRYAEDPCHLLAPSDTPRQTARGPQSTTTQTATTAAAPEVLPARHTAQTAPPQALPWRKGLPASRMRRNRDQRREVACLRAPPASARDEQRPGSP